MSAQRAKPRVTFHFDSGFGGPFETAGNMLKWYADIADGSVCFRLQHWLRVYAAVIADHGLMAMTVHTVLGIARGLRIAIGVAGRIEHLFDGCCVDLNDNFLSGTRHRICQRYADKQQ